MNSEQRSEVDKKVAQLEKKVEVLEKALIAARLELSAARPCPLCDKTKAEGCKSDSHPYSCDGKPVAV